MTVEQPKEKGQRLVAGATLPEFELTGHDRQRHRLSQVQGNDPMILILSRGHYCPKDFQQHRLLVDFYPQIAVAYTKIVTISTSSLLETNEWRDSLGAQWLFLSDTRREVQQALDIKEYTDPTHDPMIPHTVVLEPGLRIYKVYNGYWFWGRPSPAELWADLREVSRRIRTDWDIGDPEIRASWDGDRKKHFPYKGR
jgi:peroxiredoxin